MICSNCFNDEYQTITISKNFGVNGVIKTINDIECEQCPSCKDIVFTHQQSLELDKKRINFEFSAKPIPRQRFTLAHELGHIFLKHSKRDLYDAEEVREIGQVLADQSKPPKKKEADAFASELLFPYDKLKKYEADIKHIDKLAAIFHVSKEAMTIAVMNYWKYAGKKKK